MLTIQPRRCPIVQPPVIDPRDIRRFQQGVPLGTAQSEDDESQIRTIPPRMRPNAVAQQPQDSLDTPGAQVTPSDANELLTIAEREQQAHAAGLPTMTVNQDGDVKVTEPRAPALRYEIQPGAERAAQLQASPVTVSPTPQLESAPDRASIQQRTIAPRPSPFAAQTGNNAQQDDRQQPLAPNQLAPTATTEELQRMGAEKGSAASNNIELSEERLAWPQMEAASPQSPAAIAPNNAPAPAQRSFSDDVRSELDRIVEMQHTPATDRNGGFKSMLKTFLYALGPSMEAANQRAAARWQRVSWGDFFTGLAGAGGAGLAGLIDKSADERHAQQWEIKRAIDDLGRKVQTHKALIDIEADEARAAKDRATAAAQPGKRDASERKAKFAELGQRLKVMGGKYYPDRDSRLDALVNELGVSPKEGGGTHFKPQGLKTVGDELTYTELSNGRPVTVVLHSAAMSDSDKVRNAIALGQLNNSRARLNQPPLEINPELLGDLPDASAPPAQSLPTTPASTPANSSSPQPAQATAPTSKQPRPALVPSGEPAPPVPQGRGRRGGRSYQRGASSGGGDQKGASIVLTKINNLARDAREARERGYVDDARALEAQLAQEQETARRMHAAQLQLNADGTAAWKNTGTRQQPQQRQARPKLKLPLDLQPSH